MDTTHQKVPTWHPFPHVMVRCAGLPYTWLLELQAQETVEIIRHILPLEKKLQNMQSQLLAWISKQRQIAADSLTINRCRRAERCVKRLRPLSDNDYLLDWREQVADWNELAGKRDLLLRSGSSVFQQESEVAEQFLSRYASTEAFQEGVFLNSPDAVVGVRHFLAQKNRKSNGRLITRYLQRFCAKNDTASFFGPINYARLVPERADSLSLHPQGDGRAAKRHGRMSYWAAQAIADTWARDPAFVAALRLYRNARCKISMDDSNLYPIDYQVLAQADGCHTLLTIAETLSESWEQMIACVARLTSLGYLRSALMLPAYCRNPLEALEDMVRTMPVQIPTDIVSEQLRYWNNWLATFERSSLSERERLLFEGEAYFTKITNQAARRQAGHFEVDRMIFNEEAVGNLGDFQIGGRLAQRLAEQLPLVLDLLASQAVMTRQYERDYLTKMLETSNEASIPVLSLTETVISMQEEQALLWSTLIDDPRVRTVSFTREDLKRTGLLRDDLDKWPLYCAPDVMIMADSFDAIERGDFTLVLAEVHHILPPTQLPFLTFHPQAHEMEAAVLRELRTLVSPARPALTAIERQNKAIDLAPLDHALICLDWVRCEPGADPVALADVVTCLEENGDLQLRVAGKDVPLALFPDYQDAKPDPRFLQPWALPAIDKRAISLGSHTPRIVVEDVIYQRERWELDARDLALPAAPANTFAEFLALWRWKAAHGMPDQVFVWLPKEAKPSLLDFLSILSCQAYLHDKQHADRASFTEMLPAPDGLWLEVDKERYCCELRLTLFRNRVPQSPTATLS